MESDFRKIWLKNRILNYFGENDDELFDQLMRRDNGYVCEKLDVFLNEASEMNDISRQVFVVYKTYYSKMVEEEVEVLEEVTKQRSSSHLSLSQERKGKGKKKKKGKKLKDKDEDDDDRMDEDVEFLTKDEDFDDDNGTFTGKRKQKKYGKAGGRASPYTMMENVPYENQNGKRQTVTTLVTVKKIVQKVVQVAQIQGTFGVLNDEKLTDNYYVYFIKKMCSPIPSFDHLEEANSKMPSMFVICSISDNVILNMATLLKLVYIPFFEIRILNGAMCSDANRSSAPVKRETHIKPEAIICRRPSFYYILNQNTWNSETDDLLTDRNGEHCFRNAEQFVCPKNESEWILLHEILENIVNQLLRADRQSKEEKTFKLPDVFTNYDEVNLNLSADDALEEASKCILEWINILDSTYNKPVYNNGNESLTEEFDYWKETEEKFSVAVDELNSPGAKTVIKILENKDPNLLIEFRNKFEILNEIFENITENVIALKILQRFFKVLTYDDFDSINNIMSPLMESLKTVWILSKYYSNEQNMERILIGIKDVLCNRVKTTFNITILFRDPADNLESELSIVICMLEAWKSTYLNARAEFESTSGYSVSRWEFSKQILFAETDYIRTVILDLCNLLQVLKHYETLINSRFYGLVCKTAEFTSLKQKIADLTTPIEKVDFDVYLEIFRAEWQEILDDFQQDVIEVDQRLKILVIKLFSQMSYVEEGIEIVEDLTRMETRPLIHESMPYICGKVIANFSKTIKATGEDFENRKSESSEHNVYETICSAKNTISYLDSVQSRISQINELSSTNHYQEATGYYEKLKQDIQNYVNTVYKKWCDDATSIICKTLKQNVIEIKEIEKDKKLHEEEIIDVGGEVDTTSGRKSEIGFRALAMTFKWVARSKIICDNVAQNRKFEIMKKIEQAHKTPWLEFIGDATLTEKGLKFNAKFQLSMFHIVEESRKLEKLQLSLPSKVTELLSIEKSLFSNFFKVNNLIERYNDLICSLTAPEVELLKTQIRETEICIQAGLTRYTWQSAVLDEYVEQSSGKVTEIECLIHQKSVLLGKLDSYIQQIENLNFIPIVKIESELSCEEFFKILDYEQSNEVNRCLEIYKIISLTLVKLESLILKTNTGKSYLMNHFYKTYYDGILCSLKRSIIKGLLNFVMLQEGKLENTFRMQLILENKEIKCHPNFNHLHHYIKTLVIRIFTRLQRLNNWEPDSCLISHFDHEEIKHFFNHLNNDEEIKNNISNLLTSVSHLCSQVYSMNNRWTKYCNLWKYDKKSTIKKFALHCPRLVDYIAKFDFYNSLLDELEQEKELVRIGCINVDVKELINQLNKHCLEWKHNLGIQLAEDTKMYIVRMLQDIEELEDELNNELLGMERLIKILQTIETVQIMAADIDLKFSNIEENYHELFMQNFELEEEHKTLKQLLKDQWGKLYDTALYKKFSLESIKTLVQDTIQDRISNFVSNMEAFIIRYKNLDDFWKNKDFDVCISNINTLYQECVSLCKEKEQMENLQMIFETTPFECQDLLRIKMELEAHRKEFKLM